VLLEPVLLEPVLLEPLAPAPPQPGPCPAATPDSPPGATVTPE
jgi:hypothetical protein